VVWIAGDFGREPNTGDQFKAKSHGLSWEKIFSANDVDRTLWATISTKNHHYLKNEVFSSILSVVFETC
jgi:hypothetical protein